MALRDHLAVVVPLLLALTGCTGDGAVDVGGDGTAGPSVVVTTPVLGDIAGQVLGGSAAEVEVLLPPGADPHGYEPSASDGLKLREADLVVAIGLGLEEQLQDTLEAAAEDGVEVLQVGELVDPIEYAAGSGDDHAEDGDDHGEDGEATEDEHEGGLDPHVWLDPLRAGAIAQEVAAAYAAVAPDDAGTVTAAAEDYVQRMAALDEELASMLAALPEERRQLVTNHDAIGYLAARYDLEVVATVLPGTTADVDVTAEAFTDLVALLQERDIPAVFAETTDSDRLAQALASEVEGVEVVELYTDGLGEPGSGADTVQGMLRTDVERIVAALD